MGSLPDLLEQAYGELLTLQPHGGEAATLTELDPIVEEGEEEDEEAEGSTLVMEMEDDGDLDCCDAQVYGDENGGDTVVTLDTVPADRQVWGSDDSMEIDNDIEEVAEWMDIKEFQYYY